MKIRFLIMNAWAAGGTVRATFTTAGRLAERHDVEIISVLRNHEAPVLPPPPGVRLRALDDVRPDHRPRSPVAQWALRRPSRALTRHDHRHNRFSMLTDAKLLRYLPSLRDGVLIATRPALNVAMAQLVPASVVRVAQDHLHLAAYPAALRDLMRAEYPGLDAVVALTDETAAGYRELLGAGARVERIPNSAPAGGEHRADPDAKLVVAAGRLTRQKGFDRLLPAWALAAERHPGWRLEIFGAGPHEQRLRRQIERLGIGASARLRGFSAHLEEEFARASLYVMSSRTEGFPMVLLEAMSVGLPVVSFDCPTGPRDIITPGVDGYVVPDGDTLALAGAMSRLMGDREQRAAFGDAARRAATRYHPARITERWESLLDELSEAKRGAGGGRRAGSAAAVLAASARRVGAKRALNAGLGALTGYHLVSAASPSAPPPKPQPPRRLPAHYDEVARRTIRNVRPRTMTSHQKLHALIVATRHVARHGIPGAIVECGVWRGGSMQAMALTLLDMKVEDRDLHLYDTFEGMPEPTPEDRRRDGAAAAELLQSHARDSKLWAVAGLDDVKAGMADTGYPPEHVHFHVGRVEETIPEGAPEQIALLRLDTDWYQSTLHELEHLYDRVPSGGVVVFDDYDYWEGARQAVDEFLERRGLPLLLAPMGSGRITVKP
jgi:glycosyltransferase involved in cell wall biosynthesis